jgi:transitional endoplasmic reticulum ATPase
MPLAFSPDMLLPSAKLKPVPVSPHAWEELAISDAGKQFVDRKIVLPLQRSELAGKHGLAPPRAVLLFGPPGTGKSQLPRAIASRLGWSLIEADLSTVVQDPVRLADLFRESFQREDVVVFFDEFEHLGLRRAPERTDTRVLTNEFLKSVDALRADGQLLLVCATNHVTLLDPALLRPGRFDFIVPVGPPDGATRQQLLQSRVRRSDGARVDVDRVAAATDGLTAADITELWQRAAQQAFEREFFTGRPTRVGTDDLLVSSENLRPTLSDEDRAAFERDARAFARL